MTEEEESKKTEFARIQPVKVQKSMTAAELEAHKKQLEEYYAGKNVTEISEIIAAKAQIRNYSKLRIFLFCLILMFFWIGVLFSYYLNK